MCGSCFIDKQCPSGSNSDWGSGLTLTTESSTSIVYQIAKQAKQPTLVKLLLEAKADPNLSWYFLFSELSESQNQAVSHNKSFCFVLVHISTYIIVVNDVFATRYVKSKSISSYTESFSDKSLCTWCDMNTPMQQLMFEELVQIIVNITCNKGVCQKHLQ